MENFKSINNLSIENNKTYTKMDKQNIKYNRSVARSTNMNVMLNVQFKPYNGFYDNSDGFKLPDAFINKYGKFDTSKKYIGLKNNYWRNNRNYGYVNGFSKRVQLNANGKKQGDGIKRKSNTLPTVHIIKHDVIDRTPLYKTNKFWALNGENPINFDDIYKLPPYLHLLNDETQMNLIEDTYDVVDIDELSCKDCLMFEANEFCKETTSTLRHTQGLVYLSYLSDALSSVGTAIGAYFWYKMCGDLITTTKAVNTTGILDCIKETLLDIISVLVVFSKYYNDRISLSEGIAILAGYALTKKYLKDIIPTIEGLFKTLVPVQSSERHTQGVNMTTFAQGVISIIGAIFLGQLDKDFNAKNILASVKSLGSTLLTVTTCESVICNIINMFPDVLMSIMCHALPGVSLYVHVSTDKKFKDFMDKVLIYYNMKPIHIMYNSHYLHEFLVLYEYMRDYVLTKDNMARGLDTLLSTYIQWFDKVHKLADVLGLLPGKRQLPFVIWLGGSPGIGKSTMSKDLARTLVRNFVFNETGETLTDDEVHSLIYSHSTSNKFFDGYHNQPVLILNDYLQYTTAEEEQWLIRFVDTVDVPLEVSSMDNTKMGIKGEVRFTSRIIIVTSNNMYLNSSSNISTVSALNRRRDVLVKMDWKNGDKNINFSNFNYDWVNFIYQDPLDYGRVGGVISSKDEFFDDIKKQYTAFLRRSNQVLNITGFSVEEGNSLQKLVNTDKFLRNSWELLYNKLKLTVHDVLNKVVFNNGTVTIQIKHLLQFCTVGTALYAGYQALTYFLTSRISQSLSGDVSTRKYTPDRKPLQRYTMGASQNVQSVCAKIAKNTCKITTFVKLDDDRVIQQTMWGLFISGSLLITPKHLWKRGDCIPKNGDKIVIIFKGVNYDLEFDIEHLFMDKDRDLACYNTLGSIPLVPSLEHLLMSEKTLVDAQGEDGFLVLPYEGTVVTNSVKAYINNAPYIDDFGGTYNGKEIWQYNIKTVQGNCGSILILSTREKIIIGGMHVAGDSYSGNAEILDMLFLEEVKSNYVRRTQGFATDAVYNEDNEEYFDAVSDLDEGFIFLGKSKKAPYQVSKTAIVKGPLFECLQKHTSEPAVLTPSDKRLEEVVSPMIKSVSKYGTNIPKFSNELMEEAFKIVSSMYDCMENEDFQVYSHKDAINSTYTSYLEPLDIKTSAGYPWNILRKNKKDLISKDDGILSIKTELQNRINTCENMLNKRTMFPYTLTTTLKDERVSLEKVRIGKTRTFMNFPVEYTILMRRYFDAFINYETKYAREIGTTVGVNIYSSKWDDLYTELKKFDYHLDGDYKAFDGSIRPEFFILYSRLVNKFYNDKYSTHRDLLVQGCCFAPIFILDKVYIKQKGNPSGSRITTSFNSFVNRMYIVMSILGSIPDCYKTRQFFEDNIKMYVHGDDHLIGFSNLLKQYWTGFNLRDFMKSHNIDYTSSQKEKELVPYRKLEQCYYLKSFFVFDKDTRKIKCGLDKSVIQEMVSWQRDNTEISTRMILITSLRYAYFWGRDYFKEVRDKLIQSMKSKKIYIKLPYFEDLEHEYNYNHQLDFSYNYRI